MSALIEALESRKTAMTVAEAAEVLNCDTTLIYRMVKRRQLPSIRISGSIRFDPAAIIELFNKSR